MSRGKSKRRKKAKGDYFRSGSTSTHTLEHHVPALFISKAKEYHVPIQVLRDKIESWIDENGIHIRHISHKNKQGKRIKITETKKFAPSASNQTNSKRYSTDKLLYVDDIILSEYEFVLENSNSQIEHSFTATDLSKKVPGKMEQILLLYSQGLR